LEAIWLADAKVWAAATTAQGAYPDEVERLEALEIHDHILELIHMGDEQRGADVMSGHIDMKRIYSHGVDSSKRVDPRAVPFSE
jgi:hypothetical protein